MLRLSRALTLGLLLAATQLPPTQDARAEPIKLRVGHFPNITHVQGLVAHGLSRKGKGWFEERLGPDVTIEWFVYNAGPSAMEALFARSIDLTYVGPSPAINAFAKAAGKDVRIVAGAANGGAALVVQPGSGITGPDGFRGKVLATPQLGNTQDISARAWLAAGGLKITLSGGDVQVVPTANPDQLQLFAQKKLDGVWTVEPWVSRLEREAGGKVIVEDRESVTTVLVARQDVLERQRDLVRRFVEAHRALTDWIGAHPQDAQAIARDELAAEVRSEVSADLVAKAWPRIVLTNDVDRAQLKSFVDGATRVGLLRSVPDIATLVEAP